MEELAFVTRPLFYVNLFLLSKEKRFILSPNVNHQIFQKAARFFCPFRIKLCHLDSGAFFSYLCLDNLSLWLGTLAD